LYSARCFLLKAFSKHALEHIIVKVQNHYNIKRASLIQDRRIGDAFMIFESMFENHSRILSLTDANRDKYTVPRTALPPLYP